MLFNPRWGGPSLDSFIGWLETKPAHEAYNWSDGGNCACAQYAKDMGRSTEWHNRHLSAPNYQTWMRLDDLAQRSRTFGGLFRVAQTEREAV